jgi:hypothetical protein
MTIVKRRRAASIVSLTALAAGLLLPTTALGAETFYRFEENATANWRVVEECADGRLSTTLVTVIGGREFESPNLDDVNEFVTVRIRNSFTCEGTFLNEFGTGPAEYTGSESLQEAHVSGTVTLRSGETATIDVSWEGFGGTETTTNTTNFPGFSGHFTGKERQAVATGSVIVSGENLVSGPSTSASIETLEDRNVSTGP